MKLLVLTPVYTPYKGGMATIAEQNAHMAREAGHSVRVITPKYPSYKDEYIKNTHNSSIPVLFKKPLFSFGNSAFLTGIMGSIREVDCIHLHYPFISGVEFYLFIARFLYAKKIFVTYHMDLVAPNAWRGFLFKIYSLFFTPFLFFSANSIFVTSRDYAFHSRAKWLFRFFSKKIHELPNAVNTHVFFPKKVADEFYTKYGFDRSSKLVLFVGSLDRAHYFKGVDVLLRASKLMKEKYQRQFFVVVVGEGELKKRYQAYARQLGIEHDICFVGHVSDEELPSFYQAATCVVLPSRTMSEAFGIVLLEGMACGKPVISSNLPGIRTVIQDEKNGFLTRAGDWKDVAEKCEKIFSDETYAKTMGELGKNMVDEKYSYEKVKEAYLKYLETCNV